MPVNVSEQELQLRQTTIHTDPLKILKAYNLQKWASKTNKKTKKQSSPTINKWLLAECVWPGLWWEDLVPLKSATTSDTGRVERTTWKATDLK